MIILAPCAYAFNSHKCVNRKSWRVPLLDKIVVHESNDVALYEKRISQCSYNLSPAVDAINCPKGLNRKKLVRSKN